MDAQREWAELTRRILAIGCPPGLGPVPGSGDPRAALALVGEAPGEAEVRERRPFVGAAGRVLNAALEAVGLRRDAIWTTNVVKCRPVRKEARGRRNRPPTAAEVRLWRPVLELELRLVSPRVIVCLGGVAARVLIDPHFVMGRDRGRWREGLGGAAALATYHPAYLLRLDGNRRDAALSTLVADLTMARQRLEDHRAGDRR